MATHSTGSLDIFDYKKHIAYLLPSMEPETIFESLCTSIIAHYNRPVATMTELKKRELKTSVGTMWELFCQDWLRAQRDSKNCVIYDSVWTLSEWALYCEEEKSIPKGLVLGKKDIGIDLVAHSKSGYHAIQCKWKKKGKVTWTQLSTFVGLVGRTGPWSSHIIMTNGPGVIWKVRRTVKDKTLGVGTFSSTDRVTWTNLTGHLCIGHRLTDPDEASSSQSAEEKPCVAISTEEMRRARLARFG